MQIRTFRLGELQANCYMLSDLSKCVLIDPGDSADFLLEILQRENLELQAMIATHGHFDHIMAAGEIQASLPVPLYMSLEDKFLVDRLASTAKHFLGYDPTVLEPACSPIQGLTLDWAFLKLQIINTPGHSPGSLSVFLPEENCVFTGDTLFKDGIGAYDHSYSSKTQLFESLKTLFKLPEETIVYSGHGEETTIGEEKIRFML